MPARHHARKHGSRPITVGAVLTSIIAIILAVTVTIETGAWAKVAPSFGLPAITSVTQLFPSGTDRNKTGLHLTLQKPNISMPDTTGGTTATPDATTPDAMGDGTGTTLPAAASAGISISQALDWARDTTVATPHTDGYNRETQFGGWANSSELCGTGTTRDFILKRDLTDVVMNSKCQVTSGTFHDLYTGKTIDFTRGKNTSGLIQIDHVVALHDAYASGLYKADQATRVKYANDPDVLLASDGAANNTKSDGVNVYRAGKSRDQWEDSTPSVWLPSNTAYQCEYMAKRVSIKHKYNLTMSSWEKTETVDFLTQCAAR